MILNTDILQKYKEIVFWNCFEDPSGNSDDLKGTCDFVSFYKAYDSNNISYIMKVIHDQETDANEKLKIIKVTFDMKNRRVDGPLRFMLLERLVASFQMQESQQMSRARLRQDAYLFANLFKIGNFQTGSTEEYAGLIRSINPWLLSRNIDDPMNPAMTDLIRIAGQALIYEGESVSPQMQEAIDKLAYVIGPQFEQGVDFQMKNIKGEWKEAFEAENAQLSELQQNIQTLTTDNPEVEIFGPESKGIINNLLSDVSFDKRDEYYFLAHQVFYGHYNIDDAASFWSMTKKDEMRFMEATLNLIKMQIVNSIVYTNVRMNNFYNTSQDTKLIDLISESNKEANKIRKSWSKLIVRATAMKSFSNRVVVENNFAKTQKLDEISKSVDALAKNIKFLVAYPNMFPLIHIMASQEMKDKIMTWFGPVDIDSQLIIDWFFAGRISPFHNFGNDGNALDATEIIYAYYYSLATEIFKTYSTNEKIEFSDEDFFRVVVKRLLLAGENKIDKQIRQMKEDRQEFQNAIQTFQNACGEEIELQAQESEQMANAGDNFDWVKDLYNVTSARRRFANNQIPFNEMGGSIYDQTNGKTGKIGSYLKKVISRTSDGTFESIRTNQFKIQDQYSIQAVQLAKTLLDVYKTYNKDGDQQKIEEIFNEQFQEINRLKAEFASLYIEMDNEIKGCEWAFLYRDRDLRHSLIFREMKYWGDFFDAIDPVLQSLDEDQRALLSNNTYLNMSDEDVEALEDLEVKENVLWVKSKAAEIEAVRQEFMSFTVDNMYPQIYQDRMGYTKISPTSVTTFG
ncbi:MAG: hypothetical protein HRT44_10495, partial [Bdellovibrionales bacterium]|nr:hypothetical protein [Bdellovibrionales bacterium]NQZ19669.1 hypothetical protein [Bdellovibrionales bacterium]